MKEPIGLCGTKMVTQKSAGNPTIIKTRFAFSPGGFFDS